MVSPQDGKSGIRGIIDLMTSSRPGKDDFGVVSCCAFAVSATLFWLLTLSGLLGGEYTGLIRFVLSMAWVLAICGAVLLGIGFAFAGIGRAIWERRVPTYSILGFILNVLPSAFLLVILTFRA